jgi:hypothetical protein
MGRKPSPANDEIDPALVRDLLSKGEQRLLSDDEVARVRASAVEAMRTAGIRPALVYAYERTGLIVTRDNRALLSAADLDEWEDAIAEFNERTHHPTD